MTVTELFVLFLEDVEATKVEDTFRDYQRWCTEFAKLHGNKPAKAITKAEANDFKLALMKATYVVGNGGNHKDGCALLGQQVADPNEFDRGAIVTLFEEPYFTFRFADDRIIPRFHLEGIGVGRQVSVFRIDPGTGERMNMLALATVGEGGWVELSTPIIVRTGEAFVAVPEAVGASKG